jgi:DegV family protein with EDD domain
MPVTVFTDSAASLPDDLVRQLGIVTVPLHITIGDDDRLDTEVPLELLFEGPVATTSGVAPGEFLDAIERVHPQAAVIITVASDMSVTYKSAALAATLTDIPVVTIDSGTAAGAEGLVVLRAAEVAAAGGDLVAVEAAAQEVVARVELVASVAGLDHLVRSGRVPGLAGWAGRLLGLQPLFRFDHGHAHPLRPSQSRGAALDRIVTKCLSSGNPDLSRLHVAALHARCQPDAELLLERIADELEPATAFVAPFSPVMVAHTGPGLVGLGWWWEPRRD